MIRDHRPFWLFRLAAAWRDWRTARLLAPGFAALGARPVVIGPRHVELTGANISAGDDLHVIASPDAKVRLTAWPPPDETARIAIGNAVLLIGGARILAAREVVIGDGCMIAANALITDSDWHGLYDRVSLPAAEPVRLGANVWVGDGAYVGKGVTIGSNSIVAARAAVVKDVPANCIVAGVPARVVRELDPDAPRRTRLDLMADPAALKKWTWAAHRARLSGNSTPGWLRSILFPRRGD